ncbi:MAG: hypothetical protein ABI592_08125 [Acidobacteriota bacterium]
MLLVAATLAPRWWEGHLYRQTEALTGVGAAVHPGGLTEARRKIDPGRRSEQVTAALGRPSMEMGADGITRPQVWTYYYADGTMIMNLTGGIVQRISITYAPPVIPTSRRPL